MRKIKGMLITPKPVKISMNGVSGLKVSIPSLTDLKVHDKVYMEKFENGSILLIPENVYNKGV